METCPSLCCLFTSFTEYLYLFIELFLGKTSYNGTAHHPSVRIERLKCQLSEIATSQGIFIYLLLVQPCILILIIWAQHAGVDL